MRQHGIFWVFWNWLCQRSKSFLAHYCCLLLLYCPACNTSELTVHACLFMWYHPKGSQPWSHWFNHLWAADINPWHWWKQSPPLVGGDWLVFWPLRLATTCHSCHNWAPWPYRWPFWILWGDFHLPPDCLHTLLTLHHRGDTKIYHTRCSGRSHRVPDSVLSGRKLLLWISLYRNQWRPHHSHFWLPSLHHPMKQRCWTVPHLPWAL